MKNNQNAPSVNTLFTENIIDLNQKQNMYKKQSQKISKCVFDVYNFVQENHMNINQE